MEKVDPSNTSGGNLKWCSDLENSLAVPQNVKHRITMWPRNSTPSCTLKRNEDISMQILVHECS